DLVTTALLIQVVLGDGHKIGLAVHVEADVSRDIPQKTLPIHNPRRNRQSGTGEHGSILIVNRFDVVADERVRQIRRHRFIGPKTDRLPTCSYSSTVRRREREAPIYLRAFRGS